MTILGPIIKYSNALDYYQKCIYKIAEEKFKLPKGLYSLDGFVSIDDSKNFVLDNENFIKREETTDIYLFVYRSDLGLCLQDYFNLTGYPPMIPRYALGCWWYKNDKYNM